MAVAPLESLFSSHIINSEDDPKAIRIFANDSTELPFNPRRHTRLVLGLAHVPPRMKVRAVHFVLSYASRDWLEEDHSTIVARNLRSA